MKSSTALKKVLEIFEKRERHGSYFVCLVLEDIDAEKTDVYRRLKNVFEGFSIEWWLKRNDQNFAEWYQKTLISGKPHEGIMLIRDVMMQYRIHWIKWMIEGYLRAGD